MLKVIVVTVFTGLALAGVAGAAQTVPSDKVAACQKEANAGYALAWRMEPTLRPSIESHRKRMSEACAAFASGKSDSIGVLTRCLTETSSGPAHVQRARNLDHAHIERQRDLCRDLGGAGTGAQQPAAR